MREYAKLSPAFWTTSKTGRAIRKHGAEAVVVAMYLMSSPHSNMLGLFYQPILYLAEETGLGLEGASKGLECCIEAGFCVFDDESKMVWVKEMALYQISQAPLNPRDKQCIGVQREYAAMPDNPFLGEFFDRYADHFHLSARRAPPSPTGGSPKGLPSQEHEQEHEQEQEHVGPPKARKSPQQGQAVTPVAQAPVADAPARQPVSPRGRRLEQSWVLPKAWGEWALSEFPAWTADKVRMEADRFKDHWCSKAGKDANKVDWLGTWRNWCRSEIAQRTDSPRRASDPPPVTVPSDAGRKTQEFLAAEAAHQATAKAFSKDRAEEVRQKFGLRRASELAQTQDLEGTQ